MHMSLQAALVNTGFPLRCESDLQLQALSLVLSTTKKEITGLKSKNAPSALIRVGPFRRNKKQQNSSFVIVYSTKYICHSQLLLTIGKQMISKHLKSPFKNDKNLEFGIIKVEAKLSL